MKPFKPSGERSIKDISPQALRDFIMDARAFIAHNTKEGISNDVILGNLSHDIFGLADGDAWMLPRVSGFSKNHPFETDRILGSGSGLGCVLPIMNSAKL